MDRATDTAIIEQAERWFARLRADDCAAADRRAFEDWRASDPRHAEAYDETRRLWAGMLPLAADAEVAAWRRQARAAADRPRAPRLRRPLLGLAAAAAMLALAAGGYLAWRTQAPPPAVARYATAAGEVRALVLADGSRLTLNADTVLEASMGAQARTVYLRRGEAVFDVVHEAARPFVVHAAGNVIRDIGTRFDVELDGARTDITVAEGIVNVTRDGKTATLAHGEQLAVGEGLWRRRSIDPSVATGWTQGMLVFRQTPLEEAVAQANRYGRGRLVVEDPSLAQLPISGDFHAGETDSLVHALESAFPIRARRGAGDVIRLSRR
ncbi:FecR family protein [Fulvimonas soli]|jgi:transmembrane sensor|uniref:FecR family protein n=1 Tax=Fulvimonas soli TaxID=155197 RepID=A0A316HKR0_9GAMM|nr:FecR domain-containing protein [Fulvimonas soli]PWK81827.1 FecR family protein [Fulvimonas soli]TNY25991.1 hypothetical protein BV497_11080 [Fulvimonas soli]